MIPIFVHSKPWRLIPASEYLHAYLPGMSTLSAGYLLPIYLGYLVTVYTGAIVGGGILFSRPYRRQLHAAERWMLTDKIRSSFEGRAKLKRRSIEAPSKHNRRFKRRNISKLLRTFPSVRRAFQNNKCSLLNNWDGMCYRTLISLQTFIRHRTASAKCRGGIFVGMCSARKLFKFLISSDYSLRVFPCGHHLAQRLRDHTQRCGFVVVAFFTDPGG